MNREFWAVRRPGLVAGGLAIAVAAVTVWLLRAKSGTDTATVLALPVSIVSLGVTLRGLWPSPPLSRVARELADRVAQERGQTRRQALGMPGDFRPADVAFRSPLAGDEPELVRWRSDGGAEHGTLATVGGFYRSLDRGRMVVLGEPGAGKTVLATQLVIDLVEGLPDGELQPGVRPPVPVWLSLTSVDLGETASLAEASAEEIAARLDRWIALQMLAVYQVPRAAAERLIRERWVLPVLDGLDEMDTPGSEIDHAARPRAAAVVRALNAGTGRRPVVLVCRRGEYGQLARSASGATEDPVLQDASQIVLQPLDAAAIRDYLTRRFPGERPGNMAARWEQVQAALEAPAAAGQAHGLAGVLSSPWRLFLATSAYQEHNSDPGELVRVLPGRVSEHLLGQLIPAVTRRTRRLAGGYYTPGEVRAWLGTLAQHLDRTSNDPELRWSPTDLRLERLWPIAGQKTVRWLSTLASVALLGAAFAVPGLLWVHANKHWYPDTPASWAGLVAAIVGLAGACTLLTANTDPSLTRFDLHLASPAQRKNLAVSLVAGLAGGLAFGLAFALSPSLPGAIPASRTVEMAFGLAAGLATGLTAALSGHFSLAARPTSVVRENTTYALAISLVAGLVTALAAGAMYRSAFGTVAMGTGLVAGLAFGLAASLAIGLVLGLAVWIRYVIGCWLARREGLLPRRVGQFLDWAYRASLLRMSGTAAQFRHRELQDWLIQPLKDLPGPAPRHEAGSQSQVTAGLAPGARGHQNPASGVGGADPQACRRNSSEPAVQRSTAAEPDSDG